MELIVNGQKLSVPDEWRDERLLHTLREVLGLVGAKFGCGLGQCGACTVIVDGEARRSCLETTGDLQDARIETVEGPATDGALQAVRRAWLAEAAPQCGYCQAGQIMSAVALLRRNPNPDDAEIDEAMAGNLCRCGTYGRIRTAIKSAAETV